MAHPATSITQWGGDILNMQLPWHLTFCNCRAMSTGSLTFTSYHYKLTEFCEKPNHLAGYWGCIQMAMSSGGGKRVVFTQFCKKNPPWWCPAGLQVQQPCFHYCSSWSSWLQFPKAPMSSLFSPVPFSRGYGHGFQHYTIIPYKLEPFSDCLPHKIWPRAADGQLRGVPASTGQLHRIYTHYSPKGNHSCQSS